MTTLSVSGDMLERDCGNVLEALCRLGINGDVTPNRTILDGMVEHGCRVVLASRKKEDVKRLWTDLRKRCALTCAHVRLQESDVMEGCVLDAIAPSKCPGK